MAERISRITTLERTQKGFVLRSVWLCYGCWITFHYKQFPGSKESHSLILKTETKKVMESKELILTPTCHTHVVSLWQKIIYIQIVFSRPEIGIYVYCFTICIWYGFTYCKWSLDKSALVYHSGHAKTRGCSGWHLIILIPVPSQFLNY